ncbi:MAG: PQQ-binding-like beta-propeller repeat protein [Planctomycetes bacterium]|nr:PQQ-binding-like beta-propeller repeat protein [Planctomycetota bacterium]
MTETRITRSFLLALVVTLALGANAAIAGEASGEQQLPGWREELISLPHIEQAQDLFDELGILLMRIKAEENPSIRMDLWNRLIDGYEKILDQYGAKLYYKADSQTYVGIKQLVYERLFSLPAEGREILFARNDVRADILFESYELRGDYSALREIASNYIFSDTAKKALFVLGYSAMERGDHSESFVAFSNLLSWFEDDIQDSVTEVIALKARASQQLLDVGAATELIELVKTRYADREVTIGNSSVLLLDYLKEIVKDLTENDLVERLPDYSFPGGNPLSTAVAEIEASTDTVAWAATPAQPRFNTVSRGPFNPMAFFGTDRNAKVNAAIARGNVYVSNGITVSSFGLLGRRLNWQFRVNFPYQTHRYDEDDPKEANFVTVAEDKVIVNIEEPMTKRPEIFASVYLVDLPETVRRLTCLNADTGELLWQAGGSEEIRPELKGFSFNSPATVIGRTVYAIGSFCSADLKLSLFAFDLASGELQYRIFICQGQQEVNMFGWPLREVFCSSMSFTNGVLLFSTNLGAVVAVDTRSRVIKWAHTYEYIRVIPPADFSIHMRQYSWYNNPPVIVGGNVIFTPTDSSRAYCFGIESGNLVWTMHRSQLILIETEDTRQHVDSNLRFMNADDTGTVYFTGDSVVAVDASNGNQIFKSFLPERAPVVGRSAVFRDCIYSPITSGRMYRVSRSGETFSMRQIMSDDFFRYFGNTPVNLIAVDHVLVGLSNRMVLAFYDDTRMMEAAVTALRRDPRDPSLHIRMAELRSQRREIADAESSYETARNLARQFPSARTPEIEGRVRSGLYVLYTSEAQRLLAESQNAPRNLVEANLAKALDLLDKALTTTRGNDDAIRALLLQASVAKRFAVYKPEIQERFLLAMRNLASQYRGAMYEFENRGLMRVGLYCAISLAEWYEEKGDFPKSIEWLQTVIAEHPDEHFPDGTSAFEFARKRIAEMISLRGRDIYRNFDQEAARISDNAIAISSAQGLISVLELYPNALARRRTIEALAALLLEAGRAKEVVFHLSGYLREAPEQEDTLTIICFLARAYFALDMQGAAKSCLDYLESRFAGQSVNLNDEIVKIEEFALRQRANLSVTFSDDESETQPTFTVPEGILYEEEFIQTGPVQVFPVTGRVSEANRGAVYVSADAQLQKIDPVSGELLFAKQQYGTRIIELVGVGNDLLVLAKDRVGLLKDSTDEELWFYDATGNEITFATYKGGLVCLLQGTGSTNSYDLVMLDSLTGIELWKTRILGTQFFRKMIITDSFVVLHCNFPASITGYDLVTGRPAYQLVDAQLTPLMQDLIPAGGNVVLMMIKNTSVVAIDFEKKAVAWRLDDSMLAFRMIETDLPRRKLYTFGTVSNEPVIRCYSLDNGSYLHSFRPEGRGSFECVSLDMLEGNLLLLSRETPGDGAGGLSLYQSGTVRTQYQTALPGGPTWRYIQNPVIAKDHIVITSIETNTTQILEGNVLRMSTVYRLHLHAIDKRTGRIVWHRTEESSRYPTFYPAFVNDFVVTLVGSKLIVYGKSE